jgi:hypothetical protein
LFYAAAQFSGTTCGVATAVPQRRLLTDQTI